MQYINRSKKYIRKIQHVYSSFNIDDKEIKPVTSFKNFINLDCLDIKIFDETPYLISKKWVPAGSFISPSLFNFIREEAYDIGKIPFTQSGHFCRDIYQKVYDFYKNETHKISNMELLINKISENIEFTAITTREMFPNSVIIQDMSIIPLCRKFFELTPREFKRKIINNDNVYKKFVKQYLEFIISNIHDLSDAVIFKSLIDIQNKDNI